MSTIVFMSLCFFAAAVLYSSVGHAGASGYLAAMALFGMAPEVMKPTALVMNLLVSLIATSRFYRAGHFSFALLWPFALGSIPAAFVGGAIQLPGHWYKPLVGVVLVLAAVKMAWPVSSESSENGANAPEKSQPIPRGKAVLWGVLIGFLAGLTGTGGGIFLSPLLLMLGWSETRQTSGVSAAFIFVNSLAGLLGNWASVQKVSSSLPWWIVAVAIGGLVGSELGSKRFSVAVLRRLLALVLLIAGAKLILT